MSFILDALRRAEAERARGAVPGLHTPESALPTEARSEGRRAPTPRLWLGVAAALVFTGGLAWWLGSRGPANNLAAPPAAAPGQVPPVAVVVPPEPAPDASRVARPAMPLPAQAGVPPTAPPPAPSVAAQPATTVVAPPTQPTAMALPATQRPRPAIAQRPATELAQADPQTAPQTAAPAVTTRLPTLAELPETLRAQVPPLVVGGGMYAEVPSQRLAILNGQVVHEGDQPAPGLKVEQIRRRSVVFNLNGQRFEVPM